MSVAIRLSRLGRKKRPYYRVVVVDSRKKRDGAFLEDLGTYDPIDHELIALRIERINDWVGKGAQCSPAVLKLIKKQSATTAKPTTSNTTSTKAES